MDGKLYEVICLEEAREFLWMESSQTIFLWRLGFPRVAFWDPFCMVNDVPEDTHSHPPLEGSSSITR